jgi:hypothetical protein
MKTLSIVSILAAMALTACGGDDGVDGSKKLSELTVAESKDACLDLAADYPEKTIDCGDGLTLTVGITAAECNDQQTAPATCTATVDDSRACTADVYNQSDADLCSDKPLPASCSKLTQC